ncbi:putative hydro-lyase [[Clostridium] aminophilum]|uniref:putative hydro-lyase n=1 Tax=[Clostridium] aminophilum TaxID=1526 RepID=UPI003325AA29
MRKDYSQTSPEEIWKLIRAGEIDYPTAGMCAGYAQANLVILPKKYADEFREFAKKNPKPCPILEVIEGTPDVHDMGEGACITTDVPRYRIYRNGVFTDEVTDVSEYWTEDSVAFLIGCSFSFEEALLKAGIDVRHISMGCNVPMFKTNIACESAGVFEGPMVVSMRPMTPENAQKAKEITDRYPNVHGGPVEIGDAAAIGVRDVMKPDYGDPVEFKEGEIPVFWACGVTPQAAIENAKLPLVITHAPGHMFITNVRNAELNDYLEAKKQK